MAARELKRNEKGRPAAESATSDVDGWVGALLKTTRAALRPCLALGCDGLLLR